MGNVGGFCLLVFYITIVASYGGGYRKSGPPNPAPPGPRKRGIRCMGHSSFRGIALGFDIGNTLECSIIGGPIERNGGISRAYNRIISKKKR